MDLAEGNFRRGQHQYDVQSVGRDALGNPATLTLRDPYGYDITLTDPARIVFCIGRAQTISY